MNIKRRSLLTGGSAATIGWLAGGIPIPAWAQARKSLNVALFPEPNSVTAGAGFTGPALMVLGNIYDGLLRYDEKLKPMPSLATEWSVSNDQLVYTFKLKRNVKWHDGRRLNKTYRTGGGWFTPARTVHAANNLSFTLRQGETLGVVGESGSGKSTVGRCLTGLIPKDDGEILFNGHALAADVRRRSNAERGQVQMVFQDPYASLNPRHTVGSAIAAGPIAQGVGHGEAWQRTLELIQLVGLQSDAAGRWPHEFSGGQRQRIAIARALAMRPQLIVADEPVSALDVSVQAQVLELFEQVRRDFQLSMVFITHDLRVAAQMCDHIAVMRRGELVEYGETAIVLGKPQHEYTIELVAAAPRF